ncbi:hypothetical protein IT413_01875 [Candidatus Peregrinibacteria bacterium]|nr:hypothetical protein [Candidatus Peregrinibacteria bacterium]
MKKTTMYKLMTTVTLGLFTLNFTPVLAQVLEIEVIGGGYHLKGPDTLTFSPITAQFNNQTSVIDIRTADADPAEEFLEIRDENGGRPFSVSVIAIDFASSSPSGNIISATNFEIKNKDDNGGTADIDGLSGSSTSIVSLNSETENYASLETSRALFDGTGAIPGVWHIYPLLRLNVPSGTPPGLYTTTITFTVT